MRLRAEFDAMVFRREDTALTQEQQEVESAFGAFFERRCPIARVRDSEHLSPPGFDQGLWADLVEMGAVSMGVGVEAGGDGAGMVELALVAEQLGRRLAPVPFTDAVTTARLLSHVDTANARHLLQRMISGDSLGTIALLPFGGPQQLVSSGAIADAVVGLIDDELAVAQSTNGRDCPPNLGDAPLAWVTRDDEQWTRLASGAEAALLFATAGREWRLLTAASLIGAAAVSIEMAVQYAKDRRAFDLPIGAFQAISHPLVDSTTAIAAGRALVRRAAWFADNEPSEATRHVHAAYAHAARTATNATRIAIHTHGGIGVSIESDLQLYFRRTKAWPLIAGDPNDSIDAIGAIAAAMWTADVQSGAR